MSEVTQQQIHEGLIAAGASRLRADALAPTFFREMGRRGILSPERAAAFLAQLGHESAGFSRRMENLNYSWPALRRTFPRYYPTDAAAQAHHHQPELIAEQVYGGRMGNRDAGDGWKYRGRGFIMLTGRDNYEEAAAALGLPLLDDPDLISRDSATAVVVAAWWWWTRGCNALADARAFEALTRRINGGMNGAEDRASRWNAVMEAWGMEWRVAWGMK